MSRLLDYGVFFMRHVHQPLQVPTVIEHFLEKK